jgi:translation initiation factor 2 subunit 1
VTKVVPAVTPEVKEALVKDIRRIMISQALRIRADVEMKCFQFDGVLHIKVMFVIVTGSLHMEPQVYVSVADCIYFCRKP